MDKTASCRKIEQFLIIYLFTIAGTFIIGVAFNLQATDSTLQIIISVVTAVIELYSWFVVLSYYDKFKIEELVLQINI